MARHGALALLWTAILLGCAGRAEAQNLSFASASESRSILSSRDAFVTRMSPFDRSARMKTGREVSEAEFVDFAASSALDWTQREKDAVESAFRQVRTAAARLALPLPDKIRVVKTSGKEEGNAAYTRQGAIILPERMLASPDREIQKLIAHELFHIASRSHPELADELYAAIGFHPCGEIEFPKQLASRRITNPDAPSNGHCIELEAAGEKVQAVPVLFSRTAKYDVSRGGEFFEYLQLALLVATPDSGPRLLGLDQVSGFFEQIGRNTGYVIHPEEILADNFALLAIGERNVRSPEVVARLQAVLAKFAQTQADRP